MTEGEWGWWVLLRADMIRCQSWRTKKRQVQRRKINLHLREQSIKLQKRNQYDTNRAICRRHFCWIQNIHQDGWCTISNMGSFVEKRCWGWMGMVDGWRDHTTCGISVKIIAFGCHCFSVVFDPRRWGRKSTCAIIWFTTRENSTRHLNTRWM